MRLHLQPWGGGEALGGGTAPGLRSERPRVGGRRARRQRTPRAHLPAARGSQPLSHRCCPQSRPTSTLGERVELRGAWVPSLWQRAALRPHPHALPRPGGGNRSPAVPHRPHLRIDPTLLPQRSVPPRPRCSETRPTPAPRPTGPKQRRREPSSHRAGRQRSGSPRGARRDSPGAAPSSTAPGRAGCAGRCAVPVKLRASEGPGSRKPAVHGASVEAPRAQIRARHPGLGASSCGPGCSRAGKAAERPCVKLSCSHSHRNRLANL